MKYDVREIWEQYSDEEGHEFNRVEKKLSGRPDLHAFILLDKLLPSTKDLVAAAEHDEIWLNVDVEALGSVATKAQLIELIRCGVRYDAHIDALAMFV